MYLDSGGIVINIRFGNCISFKDLQKISVMKRLGFDYVESGLAPMYSAETREIDAFFEELYKNNLKCEAVNVLFGGNIRLTGNDADHPAADEYLNEIFEKTKLLGYNIVVFGSGGARKFPEGFTYEQAADQMTEVCRILEKYAEKYDFTVAVEELNRSETNLINTVGQAEEITDRCGDRIKIVADYYHIALEGGSLSDMRDLTNIAHCHTANPAGRFYNKASDDPVANKKFKGFVAALKNAGYNGRMSIEGNLSEGSPECFERESAECLEFLKSTAKI